MPFTDLSDEALLSALDQERGKFLHENALLREMVVELQARGVYPQETVEGNPNSVLTMVQGYGARWHCWRPPFKCQHCGADLCDRLVGPPFKREIGHEQNDHITYYSCPDCKEKL
jgi:hypothetical protein